MKIEKIRDDLVKAQAEAIWSANCDFSRYRFWFESNWLLSEYGDMMPEEKFNQITSMRKERKASYTLDDLTSLIGSLPFV